MIVWIVELRETDGDEGPITDITTMYVASSKEKAENWIKNHKNAVDGTWHWWIGKDLVDIEDTEWGAWDHDWQTYYPDGTPRCPYYEDVQKG